MKKSIIKSILFSIIFILVGIGLVFLGIKKVNDYNIKKDLYIESSAKVVDFEYSGSSDDGGFTIYEYSVNGEVYMVKSPVKSTSLPSVGDVITILYNPNDPSDVLFLESYDYLIMIFGVLFGGAGVLLLTKSICLKINANNIRYDNTDINNVIGPND